MKFWARCGSIALAVATFLALRPTIANAQAAAGSTRFYLGADVSSLASGRGGGRRGPATTQASPGRGPAGRAFGRGGNPSYQENGQTAPEYAIMMNHGWNAFRLRVFVSPVRQAPNNSLENIIPLAKAIKDAGATLMIDIHYSDTWADPQHQEIPLAWRNLDVAELEKQVEAYSKDVISQLKAAGAMPDMVQVGNETTGGFLWPAGHLHVPDSPVKQEANERIQKIYLEPYDEAKVWDNVTRFIKAGIRGVKAGAGDTPPQIILHIDCGGDWQVTQWWFDHITDAKIDYDIIGQSFYPRYHGTLPMLQQNMIECAKRYHKPFMVVETGYPQTGGDELMSPPEAIANPVLSAADPKAKGFYQWPGTQQGQLQYMVDLVNVVQRNGGMGVFVWAPEGSGGNGMWNRDGSPAPSIFVLDHLKSLTTRPASRVPDEPRQ
jgi:arabinogalactan endo-1,4-beta-galactosidase